MEFLKNNPIKDFVKDEIIDKLGNYKGFNEKVYIPSLEYDLFNAENQDGNFFEDDETAKNFIDNNFKYLREIFEEIRFEFDSDYTNKILLDIFDKPNRVAVVIVLEVATHILNECETIQKYWDEDEIVLTDELIDKLMSEVEKV